MNSIPKERVCDLMDGHVADGEAAHDFEAMLSDEQAMQTWHTYHVIGDVLRSAELAPSGSDQAFWQRLESRLAEEPKRPLAVEARETPPDTRLASANASLFRWKMLAGVAGIALVGVVGMGQWAQTTTGSGLQQMAVQNTVAPRASAPMLAADTSAGTMLRDARLDELMAAHRQLGGHSALQVPAGFLRNATYEGPAR